MRLISLITGASGFVGRRLVSELEDLNYEIVSPSHEICNDESHLSNYLEQRIGENKIDIVYIIGWDGVGSYDRRTSLSVQFNNLVTILNLLNVLSRYKIRKIVFGGSVAEFEYFFSFGEKSSLPPITLYGASKTYADTIVRFFCQQKQISYSSAYIHNIYGPGEISEKLICSSIKKIFNKEHLYFSAGDQLYDFVYIDDAINDLIVLKEEKFNGSFFIGYGSTRPLRIFLHELCSVFNVDDDKYRTFGSKGGASIDLDKLPYKIEYISNVANIPRTDFKEGIQKTAQYLLDQGVIFNEKSNYIWS